MKFRFNKNKKMLQIKVDEFEILATLREVREFGAACSTSNKIESSVLVEVQNPKLRDLNYKARDHFLWGYRSIDGDIFRYESVNYKVWRPKTNRYTKTKLSSEELISLAVVTAARDVKFLLKTNTLDKVIKKFSIEDWLEKQ
jgi:hypothetical protein